MKNCALISRLVAAVLVLATGNVFADVDYEVRGGTMYTDNALRQPNDVVDDTILFIGFGLSTDYESSRTKLNVLTDLELQHYVDGSYEDEVVGAFTGGFELALIPDLLTWSIDDRFGKLQTDPFSSNTPDNRENINNFSTGPDLNLRLGSVTSVELGARYQKNDFEVRDTDNEVSSGVVSLVRALSEARSIYLSGTLDAVTYDDQLVNTDYDRQAVFVGFTSRVSKGTVSIAGGINEIEIDGETADGNLIQVNFSRELSPRTKLGLVYDQRFSDAGDIFQRFQNPGSSFGEVEEIPGEGDPFESKRFSASLNHTRGRGSFNASYSATSEDYENDNPRQRTRNEARAGFGLELGSKWRANAEARFTRYDYDNVSRTDDDVNVSVRLSRQLTRALYIDLGYRYLDRSSNDAGANFSENRYRFALRFDPR